MRFRLTAFWVGVIARVFGTEQELYDHGAHILGTGFWRSLSGWLVGRIHSMHFYGVRTVDKCLGSIRSGPGQNVPGSFGRGST
jgi:hypothetical protein